MRGQLLEDIERERHDEDSSVNLNGQQVRLLEGISRYQLLQDIGSSMINRESEDNDYY